MNLLSKFSFIVSDVEEKMAKHLKCHQHLKHDMITFDLHHPSPKSSSRILGESRLQLCDMNYVTKNSHNHFIVF